MPAVCCLTLALFSLLTLKSRWVGVMPAVACEQLRCVRCEAKCDIYAAKESCEGGLEVVKKVEGVEAVEVGNEGGW